MKSENIALLMMPVVFLAGCSTINSQISGRTATEQYLVTEAIQRAVDGVRWNSLPTQNITLKVVGVQETEYEFIRADLSRSLSSIGFHIVESATEADAEMVVLVRSVGTDIWVSNIGLPLVVSSQPGVPQSVGGISIFNSNLQEGYCRMEFQGLDPVTKQVLWKIPTVNGNSYFKTTTILGFFGPYKSSDIFPERKLIRPNGYVPIPRKDN